MRPFLYRCPTTGQNVQALAVDDVSDGEALTVTCLACRLVHLVEPNTGRVVGAGED